MEGEGRRLLVHILVSTISLLAAFVSLVQPDRLHSRYSNVPSAFLILLILYSFYTNYDEQWMLMLLADKEVERTNLANWIVVAQTMSDVGTI